MDSRDVGILAVVVIGGLAIGWASAGDSVAPSPTGAASAPAESAPAPTPQGGTTAAPAAPAMSPPVNRTSEGEALDAQVQARAQGAFQSGMTDNQPESAIPTMPVPSAAPAAAPSASWSAQPATSGSGWGGQATSSGWGVQAGVAPVSPAQTATPPQSASPAPSASQQPNE